MTETEALAELADLTEADTVPELSQVALRRCLRNAVRYTAAVSGMPVAQGQQVVLGAGVYVVRQAGVLSTSALNWPMWSFNGPIASGTAQLAYAGMNDGCPWDLQAAAKAGWKEKMGKLAPMVDVASGPDKVMLSQRYAQAKSMYESFGPAVALG